MTSPDSNFTYKRDLPDPEAHQSPEESPAVLSPGSRTPISPLPDSPPDLSATETNAVPSPREKKKKRRKKKLPQEQGTEVDGGR